jgi:hypothetical protein
MTQRRFDFRQFDAELWFVKRLKDLGRHVHAGITDPDERRERIRFAIIEGKLDCGIIGKSPAGKAETFAQAFERFYGEPLEPKPRKGTSHAQSRSA